MATPESIEAGRREITRLVSEAGRDPASIEISAFHAPAEPKVIDDLAQAGADRVILELETAGRDEALEQLERYAEAVLR